MREAANRSHRTLALVACCVFCTPRAEASSDEPGALAVVQSPRSLPPREREENRTPKLEADFPGGEPGTGCVTENAPTPRRAFKFSCEIGAAEGSAADAGSPRRRPPGPERTFSAAAAGCATERGTARAVWRLACDIGFSAGGGAGTGDVAARSVLAQGEPAAGAVDAGREPAGEDGVGGARQDAPRKPDAPGPEAPLGGGFRWTLAPIRWGGNLASELRLQRIEDQPRRLQQVEIANIRAATYLWQPWFAQVTGGLGLVTNKERGSGSEGVTNPGAAGSNSTSVTGNGTLALFPMSRFPFQAMFDVSDSRASGELTRSDFRSTRIGMRQNYRPLEGNASYVASYDRSTLDSPTFGRDTVDLLAGSMSRQLGVHSFDIGANHTRNRRSTSGEGSLLNRLTARHGYRPHSALSVESLASINTADFRLLSTGAVTENRSRFLQLNTFATWRPDEDVPLYVTGGGRVFQSLVDNNGVESEARTLNANVAANYQYGRNLSLTGSASVTQAATDAGSDLLTVQGAGVTYVPDPLALGRFVYNWNATGNVFNQTGGRDGGRQNLAGQIGHNVSRNLSLGRTSALTFTLGQSYAATFDTVTTTSQTLLHNASVSWRLAPTPSSSAFVSLIGADSRTAGHNENQFQLVNLQATGQIQVDRYSFGAANLTIQGTRQNTPTTPGAGFSFNSNGSLSYQHLRAFGVPQLRYYALYAVNETQFRSRLLGDINAPREQVNQSLEQRFEYNIGRVELRLTARLARIEGKRNALIFFRLNRQFGQF